MIRRVLDGDGIGGSFHSSVDDFFVEEMPLYEPEDEGEHLFVHIEKAGLTTREVVKRASEVFGTDERSIGYAGMKDKHSTSTQFISIQGITADAVSALETDGLRVLSARLHSNKLRVGHLAGNRFRARIRGPIDGAVELAQARLDALCQRGLPNYFGTQRFGFGENVSRGRAVLTKGPRAAGGKWKAKLVLSALQSSLFNALLTRRIDEAAWDRVLEGDVLLKTGSHRPWHTEDVVTDQERYDGWDLSQTGPMYGPKMRAPRPDSVPAAWEAAILAEADLSAESFKRVGKMAPGTRRPLRAQVVSPMAAAADDGDVWVSFGLPSGSYATVLFDELCGVPAVAAN